MSGNGVLNPVDVEQAIREIANRIGRSVQVCSTRYAAYVQALAAYDHAFAVAYMAHEGPAHERRYAAEISAQEQRDARDVADVAYRHADRLARALVEELRAYQSVGASVRAMYAVAGREEA